MDETIEKHCWQLNRCNQRGGRMLSIFDLLAAGTTNLDLAAYLMARISRGSSFMVGAMPGGAGKTTVMCALLNLAPAEMSLIAATSQVVQRAINQGATGAGCYICHEIGSGPYFAYLWGEDLRRYCRLAEHGHMLATNLHANDLRQAREQVCRENEVPVEAFNRFELLIFLGISIGRRDPARRIERVYASDGLADHRLVYDAGSGLHAEPARKSGPMDRAWMESCRTFLREGFDDGVRTIEQTRERVIDLLSAGGPRPAFG